MKQGLNFSTQPLPISKQTRFAPRTDDSSLLLRRAGIFRFSNLRQGFRRLLVQEVLVAELPG